MLVHSHPDWASLSWKLIFKLTLAKLWPHQQPDHMHQLDSITFHCVMQACSRPTTDRTITLHVCGLFGQPRPQASNTKVLPGSFSGTCRQLSRPGKPIYSRKLSMPGVCLQRHQIYPVSSGTTPLLADYPSKLVLRGLKSAWAATGCQPWLYHALGGMLLGYFFLSIVARPSLCVPGWLLPDKKQAGGSCTARPKTNGS